MVTLGGFPYPPALRLDRAVGADHESPEPAAANRVLVTARVFRFLMVGACCCLGACSSSSGQRDMNYGTDVGLGYVPPDAAVTARDTAAELVPDVADEAATDAAEVADGGSGVDASVDEGN